MNLTITVVKRLVKGGFVGGIFSMFSMNHISSAAAILGPEPNPNSCFHLRENYNLSVGLYRHPVVCWQNNTKLSSGLERFRKTKSNSKTTLICHLIKYTWGLIFKNLMKNQISCDMNNKFIIHLCKLRNAYIINQQFFRITTKTKLLLS